MILAFTEQAWEDYQYWVDNDTDILHRINTLISNIKREPFKGIGKPEALKGNLAGYWSRRINDEHRLVYRVYGKDNSQTLSIVQARFHY